MKDKVFIYEGREWVPTGRVATKPIFHKINVNRKVGTMTIIEIAPNGATGSDPSFRKWVDPRELYYIKEELDDDIDVDSLGRENDESTEESEQ